MITYVDSSRIEDNKLREVWSVKEFARRHRLDPEEEKRLCKLLGDFATRHELLMNAQRPPMFR
ncbi:hypothetical protein DTW90_37105 [Neorhizobium sp. P12A]|jgi:hypothetical protein|uniref:hypothetical protein n=1 Tax=Neorhizobium sp. P12A TaxID=2268027 RepID=UPI0011EC051E|nr:hypothetical protein [Neorhizobium sp. P12A]KAA0681302.1 hypothetical protein DTW90_37105 [Neorhizobium sp. P12A]